MADNEQLYAALRNADAAGDAEGAKKIAAYIKSQGTVYKDATPALSNAMDATDNSGGIVDVQVGPDGKVIDKSAPKKSAMQMLEEIQPSMHTKQPEKEESHPIIGAGEAALSVATSIPAQIGGLLAGGIEGLSKWDRNAAAKRFEEFAGNTTYKPRTESGRGYLEGLGNAIDESKIAGLNPAMAMPTIPALKPSLNAAKNIIADSPEAAFVRQGASAAAKALTPKIAPEVLSLARKAQALDIPLRPDMLTDNKIVKMMGEAMEKVPLSGSKSEQRQVAFNRAVLQTIGGDKDAIRITPDIFDKAMTKSGETIGEIGNKTNIPLDPAFNKGLGEIVSNAEKYETSDVTKVIKNYADELYLKAEAGVIPGETFRKLNTKISTQIRNTSNGDLKHALSEFQENMHDVLERNIASAEDLATLKDARRQYAIAKVIEPLVAKSTVGNISPSALMGAVTSNKSAKSMMARGRAGDVGDLAKIGQLFLKEPASSGTAERGIAYGVLGGTAAVHPATAAALYGISNLYNRAGSGVTKALTKQDGFFARGQ